MKFLENARFDVLNGALSSQHEAYQLDGRYVGVLHVIILFVGDIVDVLCVRGVLMPLDVSTTLSQSVYFNILFEYRLVWRWKDCHLLPLLTWIRFLLEH